MDDTRRRTPEERFWPKVDKTDSCWLWTASGNKGYGRFTTKEAHVFSWELVNGPVPAGKEIDHRKTCPKRCVNPAHLRAITHKQNQENRAGPNRNSKSDFRGVYFDKWTRSINKWRPYITHDGKRIYGRRCATAEEANEAVIDLREKYFTEPW